MFSIFGTGKKSQKQNRDTQELPSEKIRRKIEEEKGPQRSEPETTPEAAGQASVDVRAVRAKEDPRSMDEFISEQRPFIRATAARTAGRFITESDDEYMTAMEAFHEAVLKYEPGRGSFPAFAAVVIKRRLLDQYRRQQKFSPELSVDGATMDGSMEEDTTDAVALNVQERVAADTTMQNRTGIRLEIEELEQKLSGYGFGFIEMKEASPRSMKTRDICREVSCMILREEIMPRIRREKHLPMREICNALEISPRKIERHRKYIIAVCEILDGDFPFLSEFLGETRKKLREAEQSSLD